ncbi:hypothetical protein B0H14DRAFT_3857575 [Mycena olivaceomarginata]|nr:hypothetical protein B0H14DRAFT_3857575 [Mycena olivaceomarginata]
MANPDHCPLFSKKDRDAWATAHRSVTLSDGGTAGTTEAHGHPSLGSLVDTLLPDKTSSPSVQRARLAEIQSEIQRHKSCIEVLELWNSSCASEQTTNDSVLSVMIYLQVVSSKDGEMWFSMRGDKKFKSLMATYAERMGKNVHNLRFHYNGVPISVHNTPESLNLENYDEIDVVEALILKVASSKDGELGDKKFKSLMATYAERMGKNVHNLRFHHNGVPISVHDTPESLNLENYDEIDVVETLILKVVSSKDGEVLFRMRRDKKFQRLMATYAERIGKDIDNLR